MGLLDRLFGRRDPEPEPWQQQRQGPADITDERAVARYRYMLRTAPPEDIERAHEEAFAQLTPEQRAMLLDELARQVPTSEMRGASTDPRTLARVATRAEMRQPGTMERTFNSPQLAGGGGGGWGGPGLGTVLLGSFAAGFIGSAIAQSFFANDTAYASSPEAADAGGDRIEGGDTGGDAGGGEGGDFGEGAGGGGSWEDAGASGDQGGGDFGAADTGGFGDFGGGDFGGDFGGGDF